MEFCFYTLALHFYTEKANTVLQDETYFIKAGGKLFF